MDTIKAVDRSTRAGRIGLHSRRPGPWVVAQLLSRARLLGVPWLAAHAGSLSSTLARVFSESWPLSW